MTGRLKNWARPLSRGTLAIVALVVAAGAALSTISAYAWVPPTWVMISPDFREGSHYAGAVTAMVGAWAASVISQRSIVAGPGNARSGAPIVVRHLSRLVAAAWLGASIALIPAMVTTAIRATAGAPNWPTLLDGYLVTAFWVMLGYLVGIWVPGRWGTPGAGVLAFIVFALPQFSPSTPLYAVAPVWSLDWPYLGDTVNFAVAMFRVLFYLAVIAALGMAAVRLAERGADRRLLAGASAATVLVAVLAVGAMAVITRPILVTAELDPPLSCGGDQEARVCLHAGFSQLLEPAEHAVTAEVQLRGWSGAPFTVVERSASFALPDADVVITADLTSARNFKDGWASQSAYALAGLGACNEDVGQGASSPSHLAAESIARELTARSGYQFISQVATSSGQGIDIGNPLAERLGAMSDAQFTDWLTRNDDAVRTCAVDPSAS